MNTIKTADAKIHTDYKNSGSPWLGEIPKHWTTARLKQVCSQYALYGANVQASEYSASGIRFIRTSDITEGGNLQPEGVYIPTELVPEHILTDGDILLSRSGTIGRSFHYQSDRYGPCSYAGYLVRFVPGPKAQSRYVYLFTKTPAFQNAAKAVAISSTIENVNAEKYANITVPVPPPEDQAAIVRYLDKADQQIQAYIGAKQKLITLLEEERQAIIRQAVTRGLDPNVRLKASGVEWLGDVPEHWEVRRLKQLAFIQAGITIGSNQGDSELIERPYLRVANVQSGQLDLSNITTIQASLSEIKRSTLKKGDVLMTEGGDIDKLGRGCIWTGDIPDCLHQNHVFAVRPNPTDLLPGFLVALMGSLQARTYFYTTAKQTTNLAATNRTTLGNLPIYLPSIAEQQDVLSLIEENARKLEYTITHSRRQIELMEEYRTRLIADVVTGKLDVRDAVEALP